MATLSINDALTRMLKLNNNSLTILSKLTESLTTTDQDYINVELWNADTTSKTTYKIPSYSFLQSELSGLSDSLALLNGTKTREYVELDDNVLKQTNFIEPSIPSNGMVLNTTIDTKTNQILNFQNIDTFANIDLSNVITSLCKEIEVEEIIFNEDTCKKFISELSEIEALGNAIVYETLIQKLVNLSIPYTVNRYLYRLEPILLEKSGDFMVSSIETPTSQSDIETDEGSEHWVILSQNYYNDYSTGKKVETGLKIGDVFITSFSNYYKITDIITENDIKYTKILDYSTNNTKLKQYDILKISSSPLIKKTLQFNMTPFIKKVVFIKEITPNLSISSHDYSKGIFVNPENLSFNKTDGSTETFKEYFLANIYEYNDFFESLKNESKISSKYAIVPNAPTLLKDNFKIVNINSYLQDTDLSAEEQNLISQLNFYISNKSSLTEKLESLKQSRQELIDAGGFESDSNIVYIDENIAVITEEITKIDSLITEKQAEIELLDPQIDTTSLTPKYQIKGLWEMPEPKIDVKDRYQDVIRFEIRYRYFSLLDTANCATKINFQKLDGTTLNVIFSEWNTTETAIRDKVLQNDGSYAWEYQDVSDTEKSINNCYIDISPYEKVEIQVRSISEAGYPEVICRSDWSNSVIIEFNS